jgi:pimeloyl-ACP methyl ester carboxylesterase
MRLILLVGLAISSWGIDAKVLGSKTLAFCHIENYSQEVLCGTHQVPENPNQPDGKKIDIKFVVIPSISETKEADPLVFFAGGPGQSAIDSAPFVARAFREVNESRDIVLIDQRGMGASNPLTCDVDTEEFMGLSPDESIRQSMQLLKDCLAKMDADVTQYTQDNANRDFNEILLALGYNKVNIVGVSWGTRTSLLYASKYPEHVRTAIMDGMAPISNKVPLFANEDAQAAIEQLFIDCQQDVACAKAFPNLKADFQSILKKLEQDRTLTMLDPNSGKLTEVTVNRDVFVNGIRGILYSSNLTRLLPIIVEQAKADDYRALIAISSAVGDTGMAIGASLTILCSEEMARITDNQITAANAKGFVGNAMIRIYQQACEFWPHAPLPAIYNEQLGAEVPTLLLSGAVDPITPPKWGDAMQLLMPNSVHFIAANTGHNVSPVGCAPKLMAQFINQADFEDLDGSCLTEVKRPSFFTSNSGPSGIKQSPDNTGSDH